MGEKEDIVQGLEEYRKKILRPARESSGEDGGLSKRIIDFVFNDSFAFLIGAAFQRGMPWERAFQIPYHIYMTGELNAIRLSTMSADELQHLLECLPVKPRYGCAKGARTLKDIANLVMKHDETGNASVVWEDVSPKEALERLQSIYGVGSGIAHMTIRILHDDWEAIRKPDQECKIDVKPDVHVRRVFKRTGLTRTEDESEAVAAARELNPDFPGELDWPAWEIGMKWCRPASPLCGDCPLMAVCPKHIYT